MRKSVISIIIQGSFGSLNVLEFFFQIFKAWKVFENRHGPWQSLNLCLKVLESAWIWFSKTPWPNKWFSESVLPESEWWIDLIITVTYWFFFINRLRPIVELSNVNWTSLYMLLKVLVRFNSVLLIFCLYGPWKSLRSPWIWFWQMGKNHDYYNCH